MMREPSPSVSVPATNSRNPFGFSVAPGLTVTFCAYVS
jgi:hypothetical protein